jgi:hypothetical protein
VATALWTSTRSWICPWKLPIDRLDQISPQTSEKPSSRKAERGIASARARWMTGEYLKPVRTTSIEPRARGHVLLAKRINRRYCPGERVTQRLQSEVPTRNCNDATIVRAYKPLLPVLPKIRLFVKKRARDPQLNLPTRTCVQNAPCLTRKKARNTIGIVGRSGCRGNRFDPMFSAPFTIRISGPVSRCACGNSERGRIFAPNPNRLTVRYISQNRVTGSYGNCSTKLLSAYGSYIAHSSSRSFMRATSVLNAAARIAIACCSVGKVQIKQAHLITTFQ